MSAVRNWLEEIGLAQYADAFEANDIDTDLLTQIDDQVLKDIGVSSAGHRLRLRNAIAKLASTAITEGISEVPASPPPSQAERRQLTVMFCDLVGSTPLSTRFDPEDLREIVGAYHRCVADTIARFGGFVAKYMGDGVLVYFGYPEAHEDDAERAARAGLAVIDAVGRLATQEPLNVRIGIATGLVVVGDLIGAGAAQERGVVGETPNLAARLQAPGAAGHPGRCRQHPATARHAVRYRGSRAPAARGLCRATACLACGRRERGRQPLRSIAFGDHTTGRPRRGARPASAALAAGEARRRACGAGLRRAGHRQVAPDRGTVATP